MSRIYEQLQIEKKDSPLRMGQSHVTCTRRAAHGRHLSSLVGEVQVKASVFWLGWWNWKRLAQLMPAGMWGPWTSQMALVWPRLQNLQTPCARVRPREKRVSQKMAPRSVIPVTNISQLQVYNVTFWCVRLSPNGHNKLLMPEGSQPTHMCGIANHTPCCSWQLYSEQLQRGRNQHCRQQDGR